MKCFTCLAMIALLPLTACKEEEKVTAYTIPKEAQPTPSMEAAQTPPTSAPSSMQADSTMVAQQDKFPQPTWTPPAHWKEDPPRPMRKGSWTIPTNGAGAVGEMTVTVFPGDVGGDLANVNRWRRQINLPPTDETTLAKDLQPVAVDGLAGKTITIDGPEKTIIGIILPREGATWFFKYTGSKDAARVEKTQIDSFLQTVSFPKQ